MGCNDQYKRLRQIWVGMKSRCYNPNNIGWRWYGGAGVKICDEWLNDFDSFYRWALGNGYQDNLTIDRIDSSGCYSPSNCRWITLQDQQRNRSNNRRLTYNGETKLVSEWAKEYSIRPKLILERIDKLGWSVEDAIAMPPDHGKQITFQGKTMSLRDWADETGIGYDTLKQRINKRGWDIKKALTAPIGSTTTHNTSHDTFLTYCGDTKTLQQWSEELQIHPETIRNRLKRGWTVDEALSIRPCSEDGVRKKKNVMLTYNGETKSLSDWANQLGVRNQLLYDRIIVLGWDIQRAFNTPVEYGNARKYSKYIDYNNQQKTIDEWASLYSINTNTLRSRIYKRGWDIEKALTTPVRKRGVCA